ncbi:hypothetical protein LDENG_00063300 [Lucifuga dentata]|nr:hypothetical protein LDENG_00063300 [Lucifuga dentata]
MLQYEKVTQTCEQASKHNQTDIKLIEDQMKKEFEMLLQFLREEEATRLHELREEQDKKKKKVEEKMESMDQMIKSLEEKMQLVEEKLDAGEDGAGDFLPHYQDTMKSTCKGYTEPDEDYGLLIDVARHLGNLKYSVWMKHIAPYNPVVLDPRTASQSLTVSPELNSVQMTPKLEQGLGRVLPVPANPERFHPYSCVLGREGYNSGIHCWDVEVGDSSNWTTGVAAQSLCRREKFEACPEAGLWCISLQEGKYQALTSPSQILYLNDSCHLKRVGVRLDWDKGTLEFMNADTDTLLFMFRHHFAEKVYPYFESIAMYGGLAVLVQKVNVRVGADPVPVEGTVIAKEDQVMQHGSSTEGDIINITRSIDSNLILGHPAEDKNSLICSSSEEKRAKPQSKRPTTKDQVVKIKSTGREKTADNKLSVKKQPSKTRYGMRYHVSLNTTLKIPDQQI